ncbi:MAG: hypothetical protein PHP14_00690 [Candidatus Pacebacteria bacterium]|nr:hypothetical protein [Candidatus Paceibacterota bacterium]MDD3808478.1 hypothetical protein [Candidatus Paceibacterota bacterium]
MFITKNKPRLVKPIINKLIIFQFLFLIEKNIPIKADTQKNIKN